MDKFVEEVLIDYVKEQHLDIKKNAKMVISEFCSEQPPLSITIYRGHTKTSNIRPGLWYSATTDINVAIKEFAGDGCCVFVIHLLDIPCIDINYYIGDKIGDKKDENEIIFLGGGTFYKNNELTEEGFFELKTNDLNKKTFECWYSLTKLSALPNITQPVKQIVRNNVEHALSIIDPDEYEFINSTDDIIFSDDTVLSNEEKQQVLNEIIKRKANGGKKIKKTKHKRKRNKKRKKRKTLKKKNSKYYKSK
jgi:hypothetical protein